MPVGQTQAKTPKAGNTLEPKRKQMAKIQSIETGGYSKTDL